MRLDHVTLWVIALMTMSLYAATALMAESPSSSFSEGPISKGTILRRTLAADPQHTYWLYIPQAGGVNAPIFVTVHGVSRNAEEHARGFQRLAEWYRVVLVAPLFPKAQLPDYQRLGRTGTGRCADRVLDQVIADVGFVTGANMERLYLFGYSGVGQFVHRYTLAYPQRVAKVAIGAAGWYTFPDPTRPYPQGIRPGRQCSDVTFTPAQFLPVPACVLVGEDDIAPDAAFNSSRRLNAQQGKTRIERGQRWIAAMTAAAHAHALETPYSFHLLPHSPHSFTRSMKRGKMGRRVFECLLGPPPHP